MSDSRLEKIIGKLQRYKGKLLPMDTFRGFVEALLGDAFNNQKLYKLTYQLKHRGYLLSLKKDIFLVKDPTSTVEEYQVIDQFYWQLLKKHLSAYVGTKCYIGGLKALELHVNNFSAPDEILIVCEAKQSSEIVMFDKKIVCKKYTVKKNNIFRDFYGLSSKIKIGPYAFRLACIELAILEALYSPTIVNQAYSHSLIKKMLKSYHKSFDLQVVEKVLSLGKHHSSTQRLHSLLGKQHAELQRGLLLLMKRYSY